MDDLNWMARYLVWLGFPFVVQEPPELVTALRDLAAEVARTAEGGADGAKRGRMARQAPPNASEESSPTGDAPGWTPGEIG